MTGHLAAATVAALIALAAVGALRRQRAAWRHAILLAAVLRFALPTPWMAKAGGMLAPYVRSRPAAIEDLGRLLSRVDGVPSLGRRAPDRGVPVDPLRLIWWSGGALVLGLWAWRAARRVAAIRAPEPTESDALARAAARLGIRDIPELRIVARAHAPGACGWLRPAVVLPEGLAEELTPAELDAVLAHELAHIARRDNLTAAAVHAIVSVFWFHPLLWWLERRLLAERETACDELVLASGAPREDYLSGILKVCRMAFGGAPGYAGINGSNLQQRMEHIMTTDPTRRSSHALRASAAALFAAAALAPLAGGFLRAQPGPQSQPGPADEMYRRGLKSLQEKKYLEAEQSFREADRLDPSNSRGLLGLVETLRAESRDDEALGLLAAQAARNPDRIDYRLAYGNLMVRAGKYDLAVAEFEKVLTLLPAGSSQRADVYLRIGEAYRRKPDLDAALVNLRKVRELEPDNLTGMTTLALVLDGAGQREEAKGLYREIIRRQPDNGVALNNLAFLVAEGGGDLDSAMELAARAKEALPNLMEIDDTLGWILLKKQDTNGAAVIFRDLTGKSPANASFHYHLGLALLAGGDRSAAAGEFRTALANKPDPAEEARIRELLR